MKTRLIGRRWNLYVKNTCRNKGKPSLDALMRAVGGAILSQGPFAGACAAGGKHTG